MTPEQFIAKWKAADLSERSACQQHFLDLCDLLGQPKPAAEDPKGEWYTFEKGVEKSDGGKGWADVWKRGFFGWEYKGKHKDLKAAYNQLLQYREALANPPLLVVCDLDRFEVHTNFTDTVKQVHAFGLDDLADGRNVLLLRNVFTNPDALRPGQTQKAITEEVAARFARLADALARRGVPPHDAAHFLMKLMFCMFAEDIELLPRELFTRTVANCKKDPAKLSKLLKGLFRAMAEGDSFGADLIKHFNGGLFADADTIDLLPAEIEQLHQAAQCDWSAVEPTIFGTLFERSLDPSKRSQIGAHYTSREDIETLLRPVLLAPLRREWEAVRERADKLWADVQAGPKKAVRGKADSRPRQKFDALLQGFLRRLTEVKVLDPACGSGNFLYVAVRMLLDLEKEVLTYAGERGLSQFPLVEPTQMLGVEVNAYAQELAQVVIWIGYLQWRHFNGYLIDRDPVLGAFENIRHGDAVLDLSDPDNPREPEWPAAEFIVGNPPFLGGKKMRAELGDGYVDRLFRVWDGRVRAEADLCCYWFEKTRAMIEAGKAKRAGLLATQGIRGGANRETLKRIKESGDMFFAESDRDWVLDGAAVHVSMVGYDDGSESTRALDGKPVNAINANLTATADITQAKRLAANVGVSFIGTMKKAPLDIDDNVARGWLDAPNPHGKPNSDVVRPWMNGMHVTQRARSKWIIDYPLEMPETEAAKYERPFQYVTETVKPLRINHREPIQAKYWWRQARPCPDLQAAIRGYDRFLCVPRVAKSRSFVWVDSVVVPDGQLVAFARADYYLFGVLQSQLHDTWAYAQGTQVREKESGFRYTPSTCFETFPFPTATDTQREAIAAAARDLDTLRSNWLNPPEWTREEVLTFPGSVGGPWGRLVQDPDERGVGTVHYRRKVPRDEQAAKDLAKRTLTNLYNARPAWLDQAHRKLDADVSAAYGWPADLSNDDILARLLELNLRRAACPQGSGASPTS